MTATTSKKSNTKATTITNQSSLTKFKKSWTAGERSDKVIHTNLMEMLVDFAKTDRNTTQLADAVRHMVVNNRSSHRTQAICTTLQSYGFTVSGHKNTTDEIKCRVKRGKVYDAAWLQACKDNPWYKVAREMQKAKPFTDPLNRVQKDYATGVIMGEYTPEQLAKIFTPEQVRVIMFLALNDNDLIEATQERMAKLEEQKKAA